MTRNKHRLYLAIYARPKNPHSYHYALHLSPKQSAGPTIKFHSKNVLQALGGSLSIPWIYEAVPVDPNLDMRLLARVRLGKIIVSPAKFEAAMKEVPVDANGENGYNCMEWVRRALVEVASRDLLEAEGVKWLGGSGWEELRKRADAFVARKKAEGRFAANYMGDGKRAPSLDLISMKEFVPSVSSKKVAKAKSI